MLAKVTEKKELFLKLFIALSLFFPAFYSIFEIDYKGIYYAGFSWPYLMAGIYMLLLLAERWKEGKLRIFLGIYLGILVIYNVFSVYYNTAYLHWYWEQINNTLGFLFFGVLVYCGEESPERGRKMLRFLLLCMIGSTLCSYLFHFTGKTGIYFCNNRLYMGVHKEQYESRNYWIYGHKAEYALMVILFTAVLLRWRKVFEKKWCWIPWIGVGLLGVVMLQTNSWTGIAGMVLVFAGMVLDMVDWKKLKAWHFAGFGAVGAAGLLVLKKIMEVRDLSSLGGRFGIWQGALEVIKKYPQGWGTRFGDSMFYTVEGWMVNNAHNVFLNAMLRFSIPVGICFTLLFICIIVYSLIEAKSFLALGMWAGVLMLMNMDYALMNFEIVMMLFLVYLVCIYKIEDVGVKDGVSEK